MANRKAAEAFILNQVGQMTESRHTVNVYKKRFEGMSDKAFDDFMKRLKTGEEKLVVVDPNFSKGGLSTEKNIKIARNLGHDFWQPLVYSSDGIIPAHITPVKFMVIDLPTRRASQSIIKKAKVPANNKTIDLLTGQVTGASKGAKLSMPEIQYCNSLNLVKVLEETIKWRGGDVKGNNAYRAMIAKYGTANSESLKPYASGVESTKTMGVFFTGAHLKNNFAKT